MIFLLLTHQGSCSKTEYSFQIPQNAYLFSIEEDFQRLAIQAKFENCGLGNIDLDLYVYKNVANVVIFHFFYAVEMSTSGALAD